MQRIQFYCLLSTLYCLLSTDYSYATAPPTANFSAFSIVISTGDSIDFTDLSDTGTAAITTWSWTFSGGTPGASTDTNPTNIKYTAAGKYDVKLFVRSDDGEDSLTKVDYICVGLPCVDFTASRTVICGNETIDFTDLSGNTPTSWAWTFSGATPGTSTAQDPTGIAYNTAGTHDVTLIATNVDGSDTLTKASYVTINPCTKFIVINTLDAGAGSLRQAILNANANVGLDTVVFDIAGAGPHTISITSAELPSLTDNLGLIIDGYTQPGAVENTSVSGALNGTLDIVVSNTTDTLVTGLTLTSNNNVIKGLVLPDWGDSTSGTGINIVASNNKVLGCYIGMDYTGTTVGGNGNTVRGISVISGNNAIGDGTAAGRNLISGSGGVGLGTGIVLTGTTNTIMGNIIGPQYDGTTPVVSSNQFIGIQVTGSSHVIGGNTAGARNIIAGNSGWGIWILGAATTVTGNYIGLAADGITAITGHKFGGVALESGATGNTIGGAGAGEGNVISGNRDGANGIGVRIRSAATTGNIIIGNIIGLAADGSSNIIGLNQFWGVYVWNGAGGNTIGGTGTGEGNVISGNGGGVQIRGDAGSNNTVVGNIIGPQQDGNTAPTTTQGTGVRIGGIGSGTSNNTIGGNSAGARNIISASASYGIEITPSGGSGNIIQGNYIGTNINGTADLGNGGDGIYIAGNSDSNEIGGIGAGQENIIAFNGGDGIDINSDTSEFNPIRRNSIFNNAQKGINLNYGVTDGNDGKPKPIIDSVGCNYIRGTAEPNDTIEIFYNHTGNSNPQGQTYIGTTVADGAGNWTYSAVFTFELGTCYITATATDASNNTSEFADCFILEIFLISIAQTDTFCLGDSITFIATLGFDNYNFFRNSSSVQNGPDSIYISTNLIDGDSIFVIGTMCGVEDTSNLIIVNIHPPLTINLQSIPSDTICIGDSVILVASGGHTYSWLPGGSTNDTLIVNPAVTTTYSVTVIDTLTDCSAQDSITIMVNSVPVVNLGPSPTKICTGDSIPLNAGNPGASYQWSSGETTQIITVDTAGTYWVEVTDNKGCQGTDTINIILNPDLIVNLPNDTGICISDSLVLDAGNPGSSYQWSTGDTTRTIIVSTAGTYWVEAIDSNSCVGRDTISLGINSLPTVNLGIDSSICLGDSIILDAGNPGASYQWSTGETTQTIITDTAGTYWVTVNDTNGCQNADTINIGIDPLPVVNLGPSPTALCPGDSIPLDAGNPGASYIWSSGETTQIIIIDTAGTYWVEVTDINGCQSTDTINIILNPALFVNLPNDTGICIGDSIELDAWNPGSSYQWSTGDTTRIIIVGTTGTYWVEVISPSGCTGGDTINIDINPLPTVDLGNDSSVCMRNSLVLDAGNPGASYLWSTGETNQTISVNSAGTYWVELTDTNGCQNADSINIGIDPLPAVNLGPDPAVFCIGDSIPLDAGNPGASYIWSNGKITRIIAANTAGTYWVWVTDANGCQEVDSVSITVKDCDSTRNTFYIPNSFSPNDDGENDLLLVKGTGIKNIKLFIYNRWGEKVFESMDISKGWDGSYKGKLLNTAVFAWYAEVEFVDNNRIYRKGNVTLIR